jgi:outer membrane protein OmpA-like peptidoglycan-associated protein
MIRKAIMIGAAAVICAMPAAAQERGTMEFGVFGSAGTFDKSLTLNSGFGVGGRIGMYLDPRWSVEFEDGEMNASRTLGLKNVNVGELTGRLVGTLVHSGAFSLLLGAGAGSSSETSFSHSYGVNGMLGARIAVSDNAAIRVEGISDWLANYNWKSNQSLHVGMSFFRNPSHKVRTVEVAAAAVPYVQRPDSVSAEEQDRRRRYEREYRALRDSVNAIQPCSCAAPAPAPVSDVETMSQRIQFQFDKSDLSPEARAILDAKVIVFGANPSMRIYITGHTDTMGTDTYNMALGERRAQSAKAYLVSKGVDANRVIIDSKGESEPVVSPVAGGKAANAPNRRDMFVLITTDAIRKE